MFDLGWAELAFLALLALIVHRICKLAHAVGKPWGKLQRFYRDWSKANPAAPTEFDCDHYKNKEV